MSSKQTTKYLGVVIDYRLTFREHLTYIGGKCAATSCSLARIMSNIGGPKQERRLLLMKVVTSVALYGAPIWAAAMIKRTYRIGVEEAYRRSALRDISAFRTVLTDAAVMVAVGLVVDVEMRKRDTRRDMDLSNPVQLVDDAWANSYKGSWTYRFIPSKVEWTKGNTVR